jgi:hypothetical protein
MCKAASFNTMLQILWFDIGMNDRRFVGVHVIQSVKQLIRRVADTT